MDSCSDQSSRVAQIYLFSFDIDTRRIHAIPNLFLLPEYYQTALAMTATAVSIPCAAWKGIVLQAVTNVVRNRSELRLA